MDSVIARGKVVEGSRAIFARAAVGLSIKSGAPRPDISTPEAFKRTLLDAKSICYSLGGSGIVAAHAIEKLGITGQMKSRTIHSDGTPAAGYVARGEAEMAIQQLNVSAPVAGTDYVGDLPGGPPRICGVCHRSHVSLEATGGGPGVDQVRHRAEGCATVEQGNDGAGMMASP